MAKAKAKKSTTKTKKKATKASPAKKSAKKTAKAKPKAKAKAKAKAKPKKPAARPARAKTEKPAPPVETASSFETEDINGAPEGEGWDEPAPPAAPVNEPVETDGGGEYEDDEMS